MCIIVECRRLVFVFIYLFIWGISSDGRAFDWQSKGHRFDPGMLHQRQGAAPDSRIKSYENKDFISRPGVHL